MRPRPRRLRELVRGIHAVPWRDTEPALQSARHLERWPPDEHVRDGVRYPFAVSMTHVGGEMYPLGAGGVAGIRM